MLRIQLLEVHEQPWCPTAVRDGVTDCLNLVENVGLQYWHVAPKLRQALAASRACRVVDLCSGGGGPWLTLRHQVGDLAGEIVLTDLYPNRPAMRHAAQRSRNRLRAEAAPVDATQVPPELAGFRTLFTAFHHFPPATARAILQDAVDSGQGIAIFEQTGRGPVAFALMLLLPLIALLTAPFVRPWRGARLFWTYVVPAIPLVLVFDGLVSCLRTYSQAELWALIAGLHGPAYLWEVGRLPSPLSPVGVTYAIGRPPASAATGADGLPRVERTT
jgi:hypothetical protein